MGMPTQFMSEYMMPNMQATMTAQFSLANGANQMGFNSTGAPNYYPSENYFNLSTTSANTYSQQRYLPQMASNLSYSNSAVCSQYYGNFIFIFKIALKFRKLLTYCLSILKF